jgi:hypothetical protein
MKTELLAEDTNMLLDLAATIADVLAENKTLVEKDSEVLLRTSIAAAEFARKAYVAVRAAVRQPHDAALAQQFLKPAKDRHDRSMARLRDQISRSIAEVCRLLDGDELSHLVDYVASIAG